MAIRLKFDPTYNVIPPVFVLATKGGDKIGAVPAMDVVVKDSMNSAKELSFSVYKYSNNIQNPIWDDIDDFKLIWCRDWNMWFEIYVEIDETNDTVKNVTCTSLGEAELSQIYLYNIEINTESDVSRDEYVPTVLYNNSNPKASLLNRILEKAPHYSVGHVDVSIKNIQRSFSFDGKTIYDAFQDIAEEINCLFDIECSTNSDGTMQREINVYDLESYCLDCGNREDYVDTCPKCGGNNILNGYGEDTSIFVSTDNLADEITYSVDTDSVKNCFRLTAGDDLMTATIMNCNPNGSGYIWNIPDKMKEDMSDALVEKLNAYDKQYEYVMNEWTVSPDTTLVGNYNALIDKYSGYTNLIPTSTNSSNGVFNNTGYQNNSVLNQSGGTQTMNGYTVTGFIQLMPGQMLRVENGEWDSNCSICCYTASKTLIKQITYSDLFENSTYGNAIIRDKSMNWYSVYSDTLKDMGYIRVSCKANGADLFVTNRKSYFKFSKMPSKITGYPSLVTYYYDTVDFQLFLQSNLMPDVTLTGATTASQEAAKLSTATLSPVAVTDLDKVSVATASNAVLAMAKILVRSNYRVQTTNESLNGTAWSGQFIITNYSNDEDTATTSTITVTINDKYETYVKQKLDQALNKDEDEITDIVQLFKLGDDDFKSELKKYCLSRLTAFNDACQGCIDILIEQGIADRETWANNDPDMYTDLYMPYYNKLGYIQDEIKLRESEIAIVIGTYDSTDTLIQPGMQTVILKEKDSVQKDMNFEDYLGENLWKEFSAYRREDEYKNDNYISDGLSNIELFQNAMDFIEQAQKEIYKSANLQHRISASIKSIISMKEFQPIVDVFQVGNWIRVRTDNKVYKLRLLDYTVSFTQYGQVESSDVSFSDVKNTSSGMSDVESVLNSAASMATSYDSVTRQASNGNKGNEKLQDWVTKGLALTKMKIIDNADNQNITFDTHGLLCKEYSPITDTYDDKQLKIINRGLYLTDDNWLTSKAGIGDFTFYNPETGKMQESYGVIADTLVGNLILSEKVGVYNTNNGIVMDQNGLTITTRSLNSNDDDTGDGTDESLSGDNLLSALTIQNEYTDSDGNKQIEKLLYIDSDGHLVLNGSIRINSSSDETVGSINDLCDPTRFGDIMENIAQEKVNDAYSYIDEQYTSVMNAATNQLESYKAEVGQYMEFGSEGLILGAKSSIFKTVIDNQGMYFKQGDVTVSYVNNNQLHIPNAVIENTLMLGNFFFAPRADGGVSLTWQNGAA